MLKEDTDDLNSRELIQEYHQIKQQLPILTHLCLLAKVSNQKYSKFAFLAFDPLRNFHKLNPLQDLDYNKLTGAIAWDYVNPVTNPNQRDQLFSFVLGRRIPPKASKHIEGVFYIASGQKVYGKSEFKMIVIIPLQSNNTQFIEHEVSRLELKPKKFQIFHRLAPIGYINGYPSPFLAFNFGTGNVTKFSIEGLTTSFIAYTEFEGEVIYLTDWARIRINDKPIRPYFKSLHLTDYTQDPEVGYGLYNCKY